MLPHPYRIVSKAFPLSFIFKKFLCVDEIDTELTRSQDDRLIKVTKSSSLDKRLSNLWNKIHSHTP